MLIDHASPGKDLGLDNEHFAFAVETTFAAYAMRQTRSTAVGALVGIGFGQVPVGAAQALTGLGRFFLWDRHFPYSLSKEQDETQPD